MTSEDLAFASIEQLAPLIRKKKLSPVELTRLLLKRIERHNPKLNAYLTVQADLAHHRARRAEKEIFTAKGSGRYRGPLHGIPISLKDNIYTRGIRTTAGSKILRDFVPAQDAAVVVRLQRAGAIVLGKTNLHEFAYGVTTNNPHFGPTRNPWDTSRIPGGSSGGSAAAIAAGLCCASLGTDTGGSIRIPAALCGIVGIKPTFDLVSCHGIVPLSRSLDHAGPLARTVGDAALLLSALAAGTPRTAQAGYTAELRKPLRRIRLALPREYFFDRLDAEVRQVIEAAARQLQQLGATLEEVSLPRVADSGEFGSRIALAEARQYHESQGWFPTRAAEYGEDVRKRLEMGAEVRAVDYLRALEVREELRAEFARAFERTDALLAPTAPIAAPLIGDEEICIGAQKESVRAALLRLNRSANFVGLPAISIPCGFTRSGLPIGLQLIGAARSEAHLLRIALDYERATEWHLRRPPGF